MVIVTELIVMSAFLSRFWLDARNSDLNEELNVSMAQVNAYQDVEQEFRLYQNQLQVANTLYLDGKNSELIQKITNVLPNDLIVSSIQLTGEDLQIKAVSFSEQAVAQFLVNLEGLEIFDKVELSQVASSIENSFVTTFTISAKYKQKTGGLN
ncbi:MAG: PilN domain-containing protein [bacterium]|nr:MAG: PilN domain-containing protein [bacterium]